MLNAMKWLVLFGILVATSLHRGGFSIQAHLFWVIALFPLFIAEIFEKKEKESWRIQKEVLWCLGLFIILILASLMTSRAGSYGFFEVTGILAGTGTFLLTAQWKNEEKIKKFLIWITILSAILILIGLGIYILYPPDRLFSTFAQFPTLFSHFPNAFALFILITLPCSFKFLIEKKNALWTGIVVLHIAGLILTFSRGSWLTAGIVGILSMVVFKKEPAENLKKLPWKKIGSITVITIISSGLLFSAAQYIRKQNFEINTVKEKILLKSREQKKSIEDRLDFYKAGIKLIQEKPLLGHGPDSFRFVAPKYQKNLLASSDHPHNLFLKIAVENGIPALIAFLIFLSFLFIQIIKKPDPLARFLLIPISAILIHNIFDYNLNFAGTQMLFWILLGFAHALTKNSNNQERKSIEISKPAILCIIFLLSITGIYETWERVIIAQGRNFINEGLYAEGLENFQKAKPIFPQDLALMKVEAIKEEMKGKIWKNLRAQSANAQRGEKFGSASSEPGELYIIKETEKEIDQNPAVSELKSALAELFMIKEENKKALLLINAAIEQDSKNWLRYYYLQAILQKKLALPINVKNLKKLIKEYLPRLRKNSYNTVATDNPRTAIKITRFLNDEEMEKKLTFFTNIERKKFEKMYNLKLAPL